MEKKLFPANCITIDGRMDEPVWDLVEEHTDFLMPLARGGGLAPQQTSFKMIPCEDRIYIGIKCMEPEMEEAIRQKNIWNSWGATAVEVFFSPSGNPQAYYQFFFGISGNRMFKYYEEGGNTQPDRYAPDIKSELYFGEDFWTVEIEVPLTAFYMTPYMAWTDKWITNVARCRRFHRPNNLDITLSSWSQITKGFGEVKKFNIMDGFPMRPKEDNVYISYVSVDMTEQTSDGYRGTMTVQTKNAVSGTYEFRSDHAETKMVTLEEGANEFTVPCYFDGCGRCNAALTLKRVEDGKEFKRYYPITVEYEPIRIFFTLPEYRANFYPGQDYSKVAGRVKAHREVTLKLEGPGIETQVLTPDADGNFTFDTPNFEYGEAFLTATMEGNELKKKIRRLAPTGKTMTWISGGNLIVNGEPVLRRNMYSPYYNIGESFLRIYENENLHESPDTKNYVGILPHYIDPSCEHPGGEATLDIMPSEKMLSACDKKMEDAKDRNFTHYYLTDEPDCRDLSTIYFRNLYNYIADKDPYHVILIATRAASEYVDCADWFEVDPYLNVMIDENGNRLHERAINILGKSIDDLVKLNRSDKCIGFMPTCFAYKTANPFAEYPTFDELMTHTWAAMIHGGRSLWSYASHDLNDRPALHEGTRYMFSSFEALDQLIMFGQRSDLLYNKEVHAVMYDKGDEKMFVLVNMTQEPKTVTLDSLTGQWHNFRRGGMIMSNTFTLKPFETLIGTSKVKDAGLPTYQETVALIDKLEYERTHGGSLLFNRQNDIVITASEPYKGLTGPYKVFDGVQNNFAWSAKGTEVFHDLDLTKVKCNIRKIVVHGHNLEGMELLVRSNGELTAPDLAEVQQEEFSMTYILKDTITPDGIRFEIHNNSKLVEFYEIEAF